MSPPAHDLNLDRARARTVIEAVEQDLRRYITDWVLPCAADPQEAFGVLGPRLEQRATDERADASDPYVLVEYIDWADTYQLLNRHGALLPGDEAQAIRELTPLLEQIGGPRNRLSHARRTNADDLELVDSLAAAALSSALQTPHLVAAAQQLAADPAWSSRTEDWLPSAVAVPNNLPVADFDETGLIGRKHEMAKLMTILKARRQRVITLVGEGGVGKTALALQCLGELVEELDAYIAVVWVSLKTRYLTSRGVERVAEIPAGLSEVWPAIASVLSMPSGAPPDDIMAALDGLPVLIALDNAESVEGDEILALIKLFPRDTDFLLTSRVGLGQLEERIAIEPLSTDSAIAMYRKFATRRGQGHLARVPQEMCARVVEGLARRPLAIRWFVEAVAAGGEPDEVLANQADLIDYCVQTVYEDLDGPSHMTATALLVADRPVLVGEIMALSELGRDDVRRGIIELDRRSLIVKNLSSEGLDQTYRLSELAADFLRRTPISDERVAIQVRWRSLLTSNEERHSEVRCGLAPSAVRATTGQERAAADLLRRAIRAPREEADEVVRDLCEKAMEIAPDFFEVPRVAGFIAASRGRPEEALRNYETAIALSQTEADKAVVNYWMSDVLARSLHNPADAETFARHANAVLNVPDTALRLGRILMWQGKLDEASDLLRQAADQAESGRTRVIARTDLVSLVKRRVERARGDGRDPIGAVKIGGDGLRDVVESPELRLADGRLHQGILALLDETARAVYSVGVGGAIDDDVSAMLEGIEAWRPFAEPYRLVPEVERVLSWMIEAPSLSNYVRSSVGYLIRGDHADPADQVRSRRTHGVVLNYHEVTAYGFIEVGDGGERLYFHRKALAGGAGEALLLRAGCPVSFQIGEWKERPCAIDVRIETADDERDAALHGRHGRVAQVPSPAFFFIADDQTGVHVFAHQTSLDDGITPSQVAVGDPVSFDAVMTDKSPQASPGSVRPLAVVPTHVVNT
jgi:cold shock CspA family protein/tetratricopeptide (TPR) repeat protein